MIQRHSRRGAFGSGLAAIAVAALALSACQSGKPMAMSVKNDSAVATLQNVNEAAAACWHKSGDRAFADLRTIPELDTSAGAPRILILRASETQGLPRMVIEASGDPVVVRTYGPLATTSTGARINADVARWAKGSRTCSAKA